jgi:hypothetical protein
MDAMRLFREKSLQEIQEIAFEIGMLGQYGLDINHPKEGPGPAALPGRIFSALQLICIRVLQKATRAPAARQEDLTVWGKMERSSRAKRAPGPTPD